MFLTRVVLNSRHRETYRLLADIYAQHRFVMSACPDGGTDAAGTEGAQSAADLLYRIDTGAEGQITLLVQAGIAQDWNRTATLHPGVICGVQSKVDQRTFVAGERYRFRLRANPTVCRVNRDAAGTRNPRREGIFDEAGQVDWLLRAGARHGFTVNRDAILTTPRGKREGFKPSREPGGNALRITCYAVDMDGVLTVTDAGAFREGIRQGVGRGKAWGCGLLTVARAA